MVSPTFSRVLPYIILAIGSSALAFQTLILFPWHHQLDAEFKELRREQAVTLAQFHEKKLARLDTIEGKITSALHEGTTAPTDRCA